MANATNYTDDTDINYKGADYEIEYGKALNANKMRDALHTKENVTNKQILSSNSTATSLAAEDNLSFTSDNAFFPSSQLVGANFANTVRTTGDQLITGKKEFTDLWLRGTATGAGLRGSFPSSGSNVGEYAFGFTTNRSDVPNKPSVVTDGSGSATYLTHKCYTCTRTAGIMLSDNAIALWGGYSGVKFYQDSSLAWQFTRSSLSGYTTGGDINWHISSTAAYGGDIANSPNARWRIDADGVHGYFADGQKAWELTAAGVRGWHHNSDPRYGGYKVAWEVSSTSAEGFNNYGTTQWRGWSSGLSDRRLKKDIRSFNGSVIEKLNKIDLVNFKFNYFDSELEQLKKEKPKTIPRPTAFSHQRVSSNEEGGNNNNELEQEQEREYELARTREQEREKERQNKIKRLEKEASATHLGVIAQDLQGLFPDTVIEDENSGMLSIKKDDLIFYLIKGVQEQQAQIQAQQKQIDELKTQVGSLLTRG